jgi:hypothetical protein
VFEMRDRQASSEQLNKDGGPTWFLPCWQGIFVSAHGSALDAKIESSSFLEVVVGILIIFCASDNSHMDLCMHM